MIKNINIIQLNLNDIENININDSIKIESNGKIINDKWNDIPEKLSILLGCFIKELWNKSLYKCFKFTWQNKEYDLWHGNTKWFTLTRIK